MARLAAREEQRHIVQRDVLWDLQDALQRLTRATARILLQDLSTLRERGGLFRATPKRSVATNLSPPSSAYGGCSRGCSPADLRELISSYVTVCTSADLDVMAYQAHRADSTPEELTALIEAKLAEIGTRYEHVIEQLGEHIRRELRGTHSGPRPRSGLANLGRPISYLWCVRTSRRRSNCDTR